MQMLMPYGAVENIPEQVMPQYALTYPTGTVTRELDVTTPRYVVNANGQIISLGAADSKRAALEAALAEARANMRWSYMSLGALLGAVIGAVFAIPSKRTQAGLMGIGIGAAAGLIATGVVNKAINVNAAATALLTEK